MFFHFFANARFEKAESLWDGLQVFQVSSPFQASDFDGVFGLAFNGLSQPAGDALLGLGTGWVDLEKIAVRGSENGLVATIGGGVLKIEKKIGTHVFFYCRICSDLNTKALAS